MFDEISDEEDIVIEDTVSAYLEEHFPKMSENQKELFEDDGK